jgi:hypothetical protein
MTFFSAVAFHLEEKIDQFPEDWFRATPYISSLNKLNK